MLFTPASEKEIFHQTGTLMIELQVCAPEGAEPQPGSRARHNVWAAGRAAFNNSPAKFWAS